MLDWNDLRYFLAVADGGSTLAAGRALRVSQTTVARRIAVLEGAVGLTLFDRRQAGYALTPAGAQLLAQARAVGSAATAFGDSAAAAARDSSGTVRLTTDELFAVTLLPPLLMELHESHPAIHIELDGAQELRNLGVGEADIALRSTAGAQPAGTVGRRVCVDDWSLYCSRDYAESHGVPRGREDLKRHALVGGGGGRIEQAYAAWIEEMGLEQQVAIHHASGTGLLAAVRSGIGLAVLPCIVAEGEPDLVRCFPPRTGHGRTLWLLTHERVRRTPRVRIVIDFLHERLKQRVSELALAT
jgi:DNA-binding transcriptional LysR family regulator